MAATRSARRRVDGVLLLDKPAAMTSNAALQVAKRLFNADKAGHTGTLDPFATGLLPICFGDATKFAQSLLDASKSYVATVHFGVATTTGDVDGEVVLQRPVEFSGEAIESVLPRFRGRFPQMPPMHSALKRNGRPYYEYAREGIELERSTREVEIKRLELVHWHAPRATFEITCSKGTYIRVLAEDLGAALGCGAHLCALRRVATGGFQLTDATSLNALADMDAITRDALLEPVEALLAQLPALEIDGQSAVALRHGKCVSVQGIAPGSYRCRDPQRSLIGVVEVEGGTLRAQRLCRTDSGQRLPPGGSPT